MKKTYISPVLHTVELCSDSTILTESSWNNVDSNKEMPSFSSQNKNTGSPIWDNNSWGAADED